MRYDPDASAMMAAELASDNRADLSGLLGREPDAAELYLAHFLGSGGAREFLTALNTDPSQSAAAVAPKAARRKPTAGRRAVAGHRFAWVPLWRQGRSRSSHHSRSA